MSVWTTKSLSREIEYIVVKHLLASINCTINGVKFRGGYAVVEKDSKTHLSLKKLPVLRGMKEFPLYFLKSLPFISRTLDIKTIWGADVYTRFLEEYEEYITKKEKEETEQAITEHLSTEGTCKCIKDGKTCGNQALDCSPSLYCKTHLLEDPKLEEVTGLKIPKFIAKHERLAIKEKFIKQLEKLKKE